MAFGFTSINDSGYTQIDQDFTNLSFKQKFNVSNITASAFYIMSGFEISANSNMIYWVVDYQNTSNSVIAVKAPNGRAVAPISLINETNSRTPPPSGYKRAIFCSGGTTAATLTVYQFDSLPTTVPSNSFGMVIRNASNQIVFNSNYPPIRIVHGATLSGATEGQNFAVTSSNSYAFVFCNPSGGVYYPSSTTARPARISGFNQTSTTNVSVSYAPHYNIGGVAASGLVDYNPAPGLIVNVTNL